MEHTLIHYKWSPKRSVQIILVLLILLLIVPFRLDTAVIKHRPVNRADLHRIIALNHPQPQLVKAIIQVESEWNPKAVSNKGAIGLMQVLPASGKIYAGTSRSELFDVEKNIQAGCKILLMYQGKSPSLRTVLSWYSGGAKGYYEKVMRAMRG